MPIALAVPGYAVPVANETDKVSLDVLGMVRDEQGRPLGRFRETLKLPPGTGKTLAGKQVLYQSGVDAAARTLLGQGGGARERDRADGHRSSRRSSSRS